MLISLLGSPKVNESSRPLFLLHSAHIRLKVLILLHLARLLLFATTLITRDESKLRGKDMSIATHSDSDVASCHLIRRRRVQPILTYVFRSCQEAPPIHKTIRQRHFDWRKAQGKKTKSSIMWYSG